MSSAGALVSAGLGFGCVPARSAKVSRSLRPFVEVDTQIPDSGDLFQVISDVTEQNG